MAEFLYLNGIPVPCDVAGGAKLDVEQLGEAKRAVDGTLRIHRRVIKRAWSFKLRLMEPVRAEFFRRLILGEGHNWNFDDATKGLYSGKGLGPSASTNAALDAAAAKQGARGLRLTATTGTVTFKALPLNANGHWTVACWRKEGAGAWFHSIHTDASYAADEQWIDGAIAADVKGSWLTPNAGAGTIKIDAAGATTDIDELVILPYRLPQLAEYANAADEIGAKWYAFINAGSTYQWPPLARLDASGYALAPDASTGLPAAARITVGGMVQDVTFSSGYIGGSLGLRPDLKHVAFKLLEV